VGQTGAVGDQRDRRGKQKVTIGVCRSGGWRRIFPSETSGKFKILFDSERPLNRLLRDEELKKIKNKPANNHPTGKTTTMSMGQDKKK
jgi:hypothetical protein